MSFNEGLGKVRLAACFFPRSQLFIELRWVLGGLHATRCQGWWIWWTELREIWVWLCGMVVTMCDKKRKRTEEKCFFNFVKKLASCRRRPW